MNCYLYRQIANHENKELSNEIICILKSHKDIHISANKTCLNLHKQKMISLHFKCFFSWKLSLKFNHFFSYVTSGKERICKQVILAFTGARMCHIKNSSKTCVDIPLTT